MRRFVVRCLLTALGPSAALPAAVVRAEVPRSHASYTQVLTDTVQMVSDSEAQRLALARGLNILNVTWEDTGRYKGSSVGSNISDMTIQVQAKDPASGQLRMFLMPVIRFPNFEDKSGDVSLDRFSLLVGNEEGNSLRRVSLREFLGNIREFLHDPRSWKGNTKSLLAPRDTHALVSAQAAFLPIPKSGEAQFNPVLFNYQSGPKNPAVLTILATREGTSVTIIDNQRDGFEAGGVWGQRLFFNDDGKRASLTGTRLSDVKLAPGPSGSNSPSAAGEEGLNMVLLIQVPLKHTANARSGMYDAEMAPAPSMAGAKSEGRRASDVENAVIGHGALEGPFTEIDDLPIERDANYPVRVTVQFYKATSNGVVSATDLDQIKAQIDRVYRDAEYVGSLVTGGETGRPTEFTGNKHEPAGWWDDFWTRNYRNTGLTREQVIWALNTLYIPGWVARPGPGDGPWDDDDRRIHPIEPPLDPIVYEE